jgi:hypothetical protein
VFVAASAPLASTAWIAALRWVSFATVKVVWLGIDVSFLPRRRGGSPVRGFAGRRRRKA